MSTPEISIRQAQQQIDEWIKATGAGYFSELTNMAIIANQTGTDLTDALQKNLEKKNVRDGGRWGS